MRIKPLRGRLIRWKGKSATTTTTRTPITTGVTIAAGVVPATRRTTTTTTNQRTTTANHVPSYAMQCASRKRRDPETPGVITEAADMDEEEAKEVKEAKEVETEHAPKAEAEVDEGGRVEKPVVHTTLQNCYKESEKIQT